jgi:hypothetical protein
LGEKRGGGRASWTAADYEDIAFLGICTPDLQVIGASQPAVVFHRVARRGLAGNIFGDPEVTCSRKAGPRIAEKFYFTVLAGRRLGKKKSRLSEQ